MSAPVILSTDSGRAPLVSWYDMEQAQEVKSAIDGARETANSLGEQLACKLEELRAWQRDTLDRDSIQMWNESIEYRRLSILCGRMGEAEAALSEAKTALRGLWTEAS